MEKNIYERNRYAWNEALGYHQKARDNSLQRGFEDPDFTTFTRDSDDILFSQLRKFDLSGKTISQAPCNNGRELLSLMQSGASEAVGFDISDTAITEARQLAEISGKNAKFVRTNVLDIDESYNRCFDFIYISEGSLQWFPDVNAYFNVISRLLKPGGEILVYEIHPFAYFIENAIHPETQNTDYAASYFDKGPYGYKNGLDYVGDIKYEAQECYWFMHTMSDIINAVIQTGFSIRDFSEYNMEMANDPVHKGYDRFPLSYTLIAQRNRP